MSILRRSFRVFPWAGCFCDWPFSEEYFFLFLSLWSHKKASNSRDESVNTVNLEKNRFQMASLGRFVRSSFSQRHTFCSRFFSCMKNVLTVAYLSLSLITYSFNNLLMFCNRGNQLLHYSGWNVFSIIVIFFCPNLHFMILQMFSVADESGTQAAQLNRWTLVTETTRKKVCVWFCVVIPK